MMGFLYLLLLAHACLAEPAAVAKPSSSDQYVYKNIFILAGQSNMAGRGGVVNGTWDGIVPPQCRPNPSILRFDAGLTWVQAQEPLHADIDVNKTCGVGPGMAFANAVLERDPGFGVLGLVPCAIGGTNISEWARGTHLYRKLVRRAEASLRDGGTIRALLWYQGESDTINREDAESYKRRLERFIVDLRSDLQSPLLPVIQVALASGEGAFVERVRAAQKGIEVVDVRCVDAKGLPLEPDSLHLTTAAQVLLGESLAEAFLQTAPAMPTSIPTSVSSHAAKSFSFSIIWSGPLSTVLNFILALFFGIYAST